MILSAKAKKLVSDVSGGKAKLGDIKKRGKEIKKDHDLALALWSTGDYYPRLLSILIFDKKLLTQNVIDQLTSDMFELDDEERNQLASGKPANERQENCFPHGNMGKESFTCSASFVLVLSGSLALDRAGPSRQ